MTSTHDPRARTLGIWRCERAFGLSVPRIPRRRAKSLREARFRWQARRIRREFVLVARAAQMAERLNREAVLEGEDA